MKSSSPTLREPLGGYGDALSNQVVLIITSLFVFVSNKEVGDIGAARNHYRRNRNRYCPSTR